MELWTLFFLWICRLVFTGSMPSDLLPSPFSLLYFSIPSRKRFLQHIIHLFSLYYFLSFAFDLIENVKNLYFSHASFRFYLFCSIEKITYHLKEISLALVDCYKKTDEWYIEWKRATTTGTKSDNELQQVLQQMTTSTNEWYKE